MTKLSEKTLHRIVTAYVASGKLAVAARAADVSEMTLYRWVKAANEDAEAEVEGSPYQITIDGTLDYFTSHMEIARALRFEHIGDKLLDDTLYGREVEVWADGRQVFEQDPRYVGVDDETMKLLGLDPPEYHRLKRTPDGRAIPAKRRVPVSTPDAIAVLASNDPETWAKKSSVAVKQDVEVSGGVWVAGQPMPGSKPSQQIAKPVAQIELVPDAVAEIIEAEVVEIEEREREPEPLASETEPQKVFAPPPPPDLAARRATTPGIQELERLARMSPEERQAAAIARNARR